MYRCYLQIFNGLISLLIKIERFNVIFILEIERDVDQLMYKIIVELVERREVKGKKWGYLNI